MSWVKHLWKSTDYITPQVMNNFEDGMEQAVNDADTMENFGVTFEDAGEEFTPNIQIKDADKLGGRLPSYFAKESELNLSGITNTSWKKDNVGAVVNEINSDLTTLISSSSSYINFPNGFKACWGAVGRWDSDSKNYRQTDYPITFRDKPVVMIQIITSNSNHYNYGFDVNYDYENSTTSYFRCVPYWRKRTNANDTGKSDDTYYYVAIGR